MANQHAAGSDPFQQAGGDPWAEEAMPPLDDSDGEHDDGQGYEGPPDYPHPQPRTFATDDTPHRVVNDVPPIWDGRNPEKQTEPYLKLLEGWLSTTRTLKRQQGMIIMQYARDDLRLIINELDIQALTSEESG